MQDGAQLDRYLFARHVPLEEKEIFVKKKEIEKNILSRAGVRHASELSTTISKNLYGFNLYLKN